MVPDNEMVHKFLLEIYQKIGSKDKYENKLKTLRLLDYEPESFEEEALVEKSESEEWFDTIQEDKDESSMKTDAIKEEIADMIEAQLNQSEHLQQVEIKDSERVTDEPFSERKFEKPVEAPLIVKEKEKNPGFMEKLTEKIRDGIKPLKSAFKTKEEELKDTTSTISLQADENDNEILTATLAELYVSQGFLEKAIKIYKKLLNEQPDKQEWAKRLAEIQDMQTTEDMSPDRFPDALQSIVTQEKEKKFLAILEKWLQNCHELKKTNM
jgi:tetratricopeptide (TPR) repeat protein